MRSHAWFEGIAAHKEVRMNQRTHTWLAIRAVALLEDAGAASGLVSMLKPNVQKASVGAWIPDMQDTKKGSGDIDNHVFEYRPRAIDPCTRDLNRTSGTRCGTRAERSPRSSPEHEEVAPQVL
jgi:hypothetical protein